jgi:hypothetical protein
MKAYKGGKSDDNIDPNLLRVMKQIEPEEGKKTIVNKSEAKYSGMLLDLIKPYHPGVPDVDEVEALLNLATLAWNLANMKKLVPLAYNAMWQETKKDFANDKDSFRLLEKLVKEKIKSYDSYDMFIHQADINNTPDGQFFVTATAKPLESFLEDNLMADEDEEDEDELNFMPGYVNRNAFTVNHKKPFLDWLGKLEPNSLFPVETLDNNIYLLEEKEDNEEIEAWLKKNFDRVFSKELEAWHSNKKQWPKHRTYQLFNEWFDVSFQSIVYDLEDYPLDKDLI